jgi:hypothetical protein
MLLFPDEPCDQSVSHHGGGRPLASSERRVQVSELWIESSFSAGTQRHCTPIRCCSSLAGEQTSEFRRLASRSGMRQRGADLRHPITLESNCRRELSTDHKTECLRGLEGVKSGQVDHGLTIAGQSGESMTQILPRRLIWGTLDSIDSLDSQIEPRAASTALPADAADAAD